MVYLKLGEIMDQIDIFSFDVQLFSQPGTGYGDAVDRLVGNGSDVLG